MQDDVGAAPLLARRLYGVVAFARALPAHAVVGRQSRATGDQRDTVGDDERRVEADTELSDEMRILGAIRGELGKKLAGARLGNCADVLDHFLTRHADAVVRDGDRPRLRVVADAN